ncbi:MAG: DUF192 domain-containing protein [Clostridiales bacterium]|nr:DUF192 domain-containing protein [Clostridiales bacterium]MCF8023057.1 DUF192 domain-containing protein [Clostridiales bacterium]
MSITNLNTAHILAYNVEYAYTFKSRLKGLMGRAGLEGALVLHPCSSIHTCFMRFPIDVLFLDKNYYILAAIKNMKPYRFSRIIKSANTVVELPAGMIEKTGTQYGDYIKF